MELRFSGTKKILSPIANIFGKRNNCLQLINFLSEYFKDMGCTSLTTGNVPFQKFNYLFHSQKAGLTFCCVDVAIKDSLPHKRVFLGCLKLGSHWFGPAHQALAAMMT